MKYLIDGFFFEKMFPVVIGVKGKMIYFTQLPNSQAVGFLFRKAVSPFLKMNLMKFLLCIHKIIFLDKSDTIRTNRANCTKSCLDMLMGVIISKMW